MAAPKKPNPGPAAQKRRLIGDRRAVDRLECAGYMVLAPSDLDKLPAQLRLDLTAILGRDQ